MTRRAPFGSALSGAALLLAAGAGPVAAVTHGFCWRGAEGFRIEGFITYPDAARGLLTERDITDFGITGWREDAFLGRWTLDALGPDTSWTLRFDADALRFPMGGVPEENTYQEWNADGFADDCGDPGFGFNGGNRAQDVCVDGVFVERSGIAPDTPLAVAPDATDPCGPLPMSALPRAGRRRL